MSFNNERKDSKACDTCADEDTSKEEYPCNKCNVYLLDLWSSKNKEDDEENEIT